MSSLQCSPTTLTSGAKSTCTVTLAQAAPSGGTVVALSSNSSTLPVAASVTVPAGSTSATFTATAGTCSANQTVTLTATLGGVSETASISLTAPVQVSSLTCSPTSLGQNSSTTCTLTLTQAAPAGGASVTLSSNAAALTVPATVSVAAGSTTATFSATSGTISSNQTATVTATYNSTSAAASISLTAPVQVSSLSCSPTSLGQNSSSTCTVTLTQVAPTGGAGVTLSSNAAALTVPATVSVAAGSATATFSATSGTISSNQTATVTATYNGASATASISLTSSASVEVSSLSCSPTTLGKNSSSTCTVTLTQAAPSGGAKATLSSNETALTVPASVTVAAGSTTATFSATTGTISSNQTATVTATYNGTSATASIGLSTSAFVSALTCSPATLTSGASATCTVAISSVSSSRLQIKLTSNDSLLTVPSSVAMLRGRLTVNFTATARTITASQAAIVTASLNGTAKSATLTLSAPQQSSAQVRLLALSCTPNTLPAQSTGLCAITLGTVADGATAQVSLGSSSASLQLPALVATRPGQTSVQFQVNSAAQVKDEAAVISAQLNGDAVQQTVSLRPSHNLAVAVPASQAVKFGSELRFQVLAADPSAALTAGPLPAGASFDGSTGVFHWTPSVAQQGTYRLAFNATNSAGDTGTASSVVQVDAGEPVVDRVANAASGSIQGACSPGAIARIEGRWLTQGSDASDPSGRSLELAGTSVQMEGESVPILYASPTRIDILCPDAVPALPLDIIVRTGGYVSQPVSTMQNAVAPGIFTVDGSGSGQGWVSLAGESKLAMVRNYLSAAEPATAGDRILILATGIAAASNVLVRIGQTEVPVESVAPVPGRAGVSQIAAIVPDGSAAGNSISLSIVGQLPDGSSVGSNSVSLAIEDK
ncbi:MAG: putative Ig domain-containing protein [Bryobacteraceae bacterium]